MFISFQKQIKNPFFLYYKHDFFFHEHYSFKFKIIL